MQSVQTYTVLFVGSVISSGDERYSQDSIGSPTQAHASRVLAVQGSRMSVLAEAEDARKKGLFRPDWMVGCMGACSDGFLI